MAEIKVLAWLISSKVSLSPWLTLAVFSLSLHTLCPVYLCPNLLL